LISMKNRLVKDGHGGWKKQIKDTDYVLVICDKSYYDKFYSDENRGKGVTWEVSIVYQMLYDNYAETAKFIPVIFDAKDIQYIPLPLKSFTYYNLNQDSEYESLYWRLRGLAKKHKPELGELRPLAEKEQKTMFFSTPINLEHWNEAYWRGMLYLFSYDNTPPALGILFENYEMGKEIFKEWKNCFGKSIDDYIKIDFIIPPFPKDCWVYFDEGRSYGKGYFVHIGSNLEKAIERAEMNKTEKEGLLIATLSRYQWMDEINGSKNRLLFEKMIDKGMPFFLLPIGINDITKPLDEKNLIIDFEYAVEMNNISFKKGVDIKSDDLCKVVLQKAEE